jgi:hypothetical protein
LVLDERSAAFCWLFGCWAVFVDPVPVGDCAWVLVDAGGFAFWVLPFEGEWVCAWLEVGFVRFDRNRSRGGQQ